jgi:signal transduction histidine kinase
VIADDGRGIQTPPASGTGHGTDTMRDRVNAIHGQLSIAPRPGGGTVVTCSIPHPALAAGHG